MMDRELDDDAVRLRLVRAAKWKAMLWVTAGCIVIGVAQCALTRL